jgi:hypothetical protein
MGPAQAGPFALQRRPNGWFSPLARAGRRPPHQLPNRAFDAHPRVAAALCNRNSAMPSELVFRVAVRRMQKSCK